MPEPVMLGQRPFKDYIYRPSEQLFDLENDPEEVHNLADDPKHNKVRDSMRKTLEEWQLNTADLWLYRDGVSLIKILQMHKHQFYDVPDRWDVDAEHPSTKGIPLISKEMSDGEIAEAGRMLKSSTEGAR